MSGAEAPAAAKKKSNKINKICVESPAASAPGAPAAGGACDAVPPAQNRSGGGRVADPHDEMPIGKKGPSTFEELLDMMAQPSAIKRLIEPEDVGYVAVLLASDAGAGITGSMISIDGGVAPY